jgi:hypothetical protein
MTNSINFDEISVLEEEAEGRLLIKEAWVQFRDTPCMIYTYIGKKYRVFLFMFPSFDVFKRFEEDLSLLECDKFI